ncbi:hypothetical protein JCM10908_006604 [Rhodotorula pacifica]|uniref:dolichyl-P-Glc:Glc(2)Man(9)GlcNAc(2)-PP-dolichol alpha-1,2- glucosyltransferase n=1 Tax=Rhodotorula pacifica TaxID=1495444 RepID=UPI00316E7D79
MRTPLWWLAYTAWFTGSVLVATRINEHVPEPYMDEIFHVTQAQAYCRGDRRYWDPALTTPPGLYLLPALLSHLQRQLPFLERLAPDACSVPALRAFNLLLSFSLPFLYSSLLSLLHTSPRRKPTSYAWEGLVIALFPVLGWWAWMYYTDLASVLAVLVSWRYALQRRYAFSAAAGAVSLLFRQTNIVWLAFIAGQAAIARLRFASAGTGVSRLHDPLLQKARLGHLVVVPMSVILAALRNFPALLPVLASYLPVFAAALAFVRWNGGIVLGDKANHVPTLHLAQVWYFLAFAAAFFAPQVLGVRPVMRALVGSVRTPGRLLGSVLALSTILYAIHHYTVAHPFLLADNRHYAFYLWRRVINVHPYARYGLAPGYFVAARLLWIQLAGAGTMRLSTLLLFTGATCAVLIPTPLLEPRYFLTPMLILRLYLSFSSSNASITPRTNSRQRLALEAALYIVVQLVCVWLFLDRPFRWEIEVGVDGKGLHGRDEREVGRWQRFMW